MKHWGHVAAVLITIFIAALIGCAGTPATKSGSLSLMEPPITFDESDVGHEIETESQGLRDDSTGGYTVHHAIDYDRVPAKVIARGVSMRAGPGISASSMGKVSKGTGLNVLEIREDGWCFVETLQGDRGYIWAPLLDIEGRKFKTARYRGMRHILVSSNYYLGPDGVKRSRLEVRGLDFRKPIASIRLTGRYGVRKKHPVNGGRNKMHQGIDLKAMVGTSVKAAASGIVKSVRRGSNYGIYVDIKHKLGYTTRYAHLSRSLVKKGQRVKAGQIIARSGNTGATTGPHLHFEIHKKGRSINPLKHITARR